MGPPAHHAGALPARHRDRGRDARGGRNPHSPYAPFGPEEVLVSEATDVISLAGDANVVDVTIGPDAPIVGYTLEEAVREGVLDDDSLVIAIERDDRVLTPHGTTTVRPDDIVTVLSRSGDTDRVLEAFIAREAAQDD